jgi:hypothetical protein
MVSIVVIDVLTKTVVRHEEDNPNQQKLVSHCLKTCGIDLVEWKYESEIVTPKGNLITKVGVSEYKQIYLTIF